MDPEHSFNQKINYEQRKYDSSVTIDYVYGIASLVVICIGIMGNFVGSVLLFRSRETQSAHFVYYKTLTLAELMYCVNFVLVKLISSFGMNWYAKYDFVFTSSIAAEYTTKVSRLINSSAGYIVMYISVLILIDRIHILSRTVAETSAIKFRRALLSMLTVVAIATVVHSWDTFVQVVIYAKQDYNSTFYLAVPRTGPNSYTIASHVNAIYNRVIRLTYPIVLLVLSIWLCIKYKRYLDRKATLTGRGVNPNQTEKDFLIVLLAVIVVLAFIQVIPAETNRIYGMVRNEMISPDAALNDSISFEEFKQVIDTAVLDRSLYQLANFCTYVDRSVKFYCYIMFNRMFRKEFLKLIKCYSGQNLSPAHVRVTLIGRTARGQACSEL